MPINASYEYLNAEREYLNAKTLEDKIYWLEEMIRKAPKHKSSEHLLVELKRRLKKFQEKEEKASKKTGGRKGVRKEGFQFVLVGKTNKGKSALLARLTNAKPLVADYQFTTRQSEIGTFNFQDVKAQVIDMPSIGSEYFDVGVVNTADCLLIVVESFEEIKEVESYLTRTRGKRIYVFNKVDRYDEIEKRRVISRIRSEKINGELVSAERGEGIDELKRKMFEEMDVMRIYLKEPGMEIKGEPLVLKKGSTIRDVAESILKGFSARVKETRVTGPSAKFPNQKIGFAHEVKDKDVVEFHTR